MNHEQLQIDVCDRFDVDFFPSPSGLKIGIIENVKTGVVPIHGTRHRPTKTTTGWYVWAGDEFSKDPDFFKPLHVIHLSEWCVAIIPYLGLPPGWRFLITENYEDVWFDEDLL